MKHALLAALFCCSAALAQFEKMEPRTFANADGKTLTDVITKYDADKKEVSLEKSGKIPLEKFSQDDQAFILHWAQVEGFKSSMRFKLELKKQNWESMKHEQSITPFYMDAIQIPGKRTPSHNIIMLEDYEEYNAVYLEAQGYEIKIRNQNFFPIENITVESKIFYEQEQYLIPDSMYNSGESEYSETVTTNKFRFLSETIPIIVPREDVFLNSEAAIIIDHQIERSSLVTSSNTEEEDDDSDYDLGDWDDHGRRRKGRVLGVWFRVGITGLDGEMVWRDISAPSSLKDKWESFDLAGLPEAEETEEGEEGEEE